MRLLQASWALAALLTCSPQAGAGEVVYYSLDRMYIRPSLPLPVVAPRGRLEIQLCHSYPTALHNVRLIPVCRNLIATPVPPSLPVLKPTTVAALSLDLTTKDPPPGDALLLQMGIAADEIKSDAKADIEIPLTKAAGERLTAKRAIPVGDVQVRVRRYGDALFLGYLIPTVLIFGWLIWRRRQAG